MVSSANQSKRQVTQNAAAPWILTLGGQIAALVAAVGGVAGAHEYLPIPVYVILGITGVLLVSATPFLWLHKGNAYRGHAWVSAAVGVVVLAGAYTLFPLPQSASGGTPPPEKTTSNLDYHCTIIVGHGRFAHDLFANAGGDPQSGIKIVSASSQGTTLQVTTPSTSIKAEFGTFTIWPDGTIAYDVTNEAGVGQVDSVQLTVLLIDGTTRTQSQFISLIGDDLQGTDGKDTVHGSSRSDEISGKGDTDYLYGLDGDDDVAGGAADDFIDGGFNNDSLAGNGGNDTLIGGPGDDRIDGGPGNDNIYSDGGTKDFYEGSDVAYGGTGRDYLFGGRGTDSLYGDEGNDAIYGWDGPDRLEGGSGDDDLVGGAGADTLSGGEGGDKFWFMNPADGGDTILDFSVAEGDKLELSHLVASQDFKSPLQLAGYLVAETVGNNTRLWLDSTGAGRIDGAFEIATIDGVSVSANEILLSGAVIY